MLYVQSSIRDLYTVEWSVTITSIIVRGTEAWSQIIVPVYLAKKDTAAVAKNLTLAKHVRKSGVAWQPKSNNVLIPVNGSDQVVVTTTTPKRTESLISVRVVVDMVTAEKAKLVGQVIWDRKLPVSTKFALSYPSPERHTSQL